MRRNRNPGSLVACRNYEAGPRGYTRILGYERFDGQQSPSDITGDQTTDNYDQTYINQRRLAIGPVPGAGEVLAVYRFKGRTYAFKEGPGGEVAIWGSGPSGWESVLLSTQLRPGGQGVWKFITANFHGQDDRRLVFGINPGGKVFWFDGSSLETINTGVHIEGVLPVDIAAHQNHLWVAYEGGSVIHSVLGDPTNFSGSAGAGEIATGDSCTGMIAGYAGTLIIFGQSTISVLYGTSSEDWERKELRADAGAYERSMVLMHVPVFLSDGGIRTLETTQAFGGLSLGLSSDQIATVFHRKAGNAKVVAALRVRSKSQYRLFFDDGDCVVMSLYEDWRGNLQAAFSISDYDMHDEQDRWSPGIVTSACSVSEREDGRERMFFTMLGSPFVYEMDRGYSFDGRAITAMITTAPNDFGNPGWLKHFGRFSIEVDSSRTSSLKMQAFYDDLMVEGPPEQSRTVRGDRAIWDQGHWNEMEWDSRGEPTASARMYGRGRNVSVSVYSEGNAVEPPHTLTGITAYYEPRRVLR